MEHKSLKSAGFCVIVPMPANVILKSLNIQCSTIDLIHKLLRASRAHTKLSPLQVSV